MNALASPDTSASTLDFTAANGVPFRARVVLPGDDFGAFSRQNGWALQAKKDAEPVVEFYDKRYDHSPHGQFVSRYYLETLQERGSNAGQGLLLDGGIPEWSVDGANLSKVVAWAEVHAAYRKENALDPVAIGYLKAALFTEVDEHDRPLDQLFTTDSVSSETREQAKAACDLFCKTNEGLVKQAMSLDSYTDGRLGHDFWLTRNGHGCGFWDRDELNVPAVDEEGKTTGKTLGDALSEAAKAAKECDLYIGDDGQAYMTPETTAKTPRP